MLVATNTPRRRADQLRRANHAHVSHEIVYLARSAKLSNSPELSIKETAAWATSSFSPATDLWV